MSLLHSYYLPQLVCRVALASYSIYCRSTESDQQRSITNITSELPMYICTCQNRIRLEDF
ncbi:11508_t:CDS:2 [Rhizophagus irregularis]|nr:11508_t:CDS:2 [Rhizophagus irregularis]